MKRITFLPSILAAATLALAGCKKAAPAAPPAPTAGGVTIDLPKLRAAFPTPNPEVRTCFSEASFGIRYEDYNKTLVALEKLAATPNLTEEQKKVVGEVVEQVKKASGR
jgi:hypothetical protein